MLLAQLEAGNRHMMLAGQGFGEGWVRLMVIAVVGQLEEGWKGDMDLIQN